MKSNLTFRTVLLALTLLLGGGISWGETINGTKNFVAKSRIASISDGTITAAYNAGNGYALAIADLSDVDKIGDATTVTLEFDVQIATGTRWYVGIGDKSTRGENANGSTSATYKTEGLLIRFGTKDGDNYRVNDGTANNNAFGVLNHVTFTLDRINKTYSYTITDKATGNTTFFSASNVATDIDNTTVVEVYSWLNDAEITISDVSYSFEDNVVTSNGTSDMTATNRITNNNDGTFTTAANAGNEYALALADLSSIDKIDRATSITLEFDVNIASGSRWLIGIGDKDTRGTNANSSSKSTYNTDGLIMRFGTKDGTYYRVNDGTNNSDAFGVLTHVTFTLDRVNKTYSYTIKDQATGNTTYFSASDVETDIDNATVVEAYSWLGSTTITISNVSYYFEYVLEPYDYTVKAVDSSNSVIKTLAEGTDTEKHSVYYPFAFQEGGKWYTTAETSYIVEVSKDDADKTVVYTDDTNIVAYAEGETGTNTAEYATVSASYSNGKAGHVTGQNYHPRGLTLGTFAAGTYEFVAKIVDNANRGLCVRNLTSNTSSNDDCYTWAATDNSSTGVQKVTFTLDAAYTLLLNGKDGTGNTANQSADFDYAYIRKLSMPMTISSAEWATLYTPYPLDFSSTGLKAYTATVANDVVTLASVTDVPAYTGIVLNGTAGDYTIPTLSGSTTDKGDLQGSLTQALAYDANATNDYYMLALTNNGKTVQFSKLTSGSIAAGKAYLVLPKDPTNGARTLTVAFAEGGTTGIRNIENDEWRKEHFYNLNGQRVSQPTKGLYIVNGKKVVVK